MVELRESVLGSCGGEEPLAPPNPPQPPRSYERIQLQKSNVCSRAYFVVVMVFFHLYIINIIALLLYVHYNTGSNEVTTGEQELPMSSNPSVICLPPRTEHHTPIREPHLDYPFRLPRLEGIRVGHVQRVALVPDQTHEMRTLSLKPLLFEIPGFLSQEESAVVMQLAQLKGLTQSSVSQASDTQEELSQEELFSLLDLNQDGLLQRDEVTDRGGKEHKTESDRQREVYHCKNNVLS
ncbi:transmembrane prolyl 4-hydroxylase [Chanos chanos]|uniref:Transmembrane prolyl 4-hydroxylase n=1 Tax=Chanos chanos TaxID=29144 RepID=A0A6J2UT48_CHACN|nr:transmembrane prolyl 4-hydroxylase-like [Chanos chanos]